MAERYKLPDALGGVECTIGVNPYPPPPSGWVRAVVGSGPEQLVLDIPYDALTPAKPPTPPEPEPGAYEINRRLCVWFRGDSSSTRWSWEDSADNWSFGTWDALWASIGGPDVTITPLVPAGPEVALPWVGGNDADPGGDSIRVDTFDGDHVPVSIPGRSMVYLNPHKAEAMAYALLAASRAGLTAKTVELPWELDGESPTFFVKVDPDCPKRVRFGFYGVASRVVSPEKARGISGAFDAAASRAESRTEK